MFQLGNTLVSEELLKLTSLVICRSAREHVAWRAAGAPLDQTEADRLVKDYEAISPFWILLGRLRSAHGLSIVAKDQSLETPLVEGKACAYATFDKRGWAHCGIEQAHHAGAVDWKNQSPVICILFV